MSSTHKTTSAYSVANVLTKIIRHEERIYCRNAVISIDTSESYNETAAVHITATMTDGLEIFMSNDEHGRNLSLELDSHTRVHFEKSPASLQLTLLDRRGAQIRMTSDAMTFCEMIIPPRQDGALIHVEQPAVLAFTRNGRLTRVLSESDKVETILPNGQTLRCSGVIPEPDHLTIDKNLKNIRKLTRGGFVRRVQISEDLRITTRKVGSSEEQQGKGGEEILVEQPGLPRLGVSTVTKIGYVALQEGMFLMVDEGMRCLLVAGTNAVMVTPDGLLFAGQTRLFCELLGIRGERERQTCIRTDRQIPSYTNRKQAARQTNREADRETGR